MNLPTGQVSCVPPEAGTLEGTIICIQGGTGVLRKDSLVKFVTEKGSITDAECNDEGLLELIMAELNRDPGARMTNEIGIGANRMSRVDINPLDAEKNRGSISIRFGGPHNNSVAQLNLLIPGASATLTEKKEKIPLI
jgi:leucyl aminopeptidase (aminopeptidase T)